MESISGNIIREELPQNLTKSQEKSMQKPEADEAVFQDSAEQNEQRRNLLKQGNRKEENDKDGDRDAEQLQKNADMMHGFGSKDY